MRKLVYYVAVSIDGFIADPNGGFDAFLNEGDHDPVVYEEFADALPGHARTALGIDRPLSRFDTVIMGWNTLTPALRVGIPSPYPHLRQVVVSRRTRDADSAITMTNDPVSMVRALKHEDGLDIWLCGGGQLAGGLLPEIDRVVLKRHPVVFGSGVPLFGGAPYSPRTFALASARSFESGVIVEEYVQEH